MSKLKLKTAITIVIFTVIITFAFVVLIFQFQRTTSISINDIDGTVMILDETSLTEYIKYGNSPIPNAGQLLNLSSYNKNVVSSMFNSVLPFAIGFLIFLSFSTVILINLIRFYQNKELKNLKSELYAISDGDRYVKNNPQLTEVYKKLEKRFTDNLNDYKTLNTYLSHEHKNAIAILRASLETSDNKDYINHLDNIKDSIEDVLTLSDNGIYEELSPVDVSLITAEICDKYQKIQKNINFEFDENEPSEIIGRERWIYRAISNLLDNAVKYGEDEPINVKVIAKNYSVIVTVHDNGIGIPIEKQELIYNNHFRLNALKKDGFGIGLSLVSHVCDLCTGFVWVDSSKEEGTTFYLSFPQIR